MTDAAHRPNVPACPGHGSTDRVRDNGYVTEAQQEPTFYELIGGEQTFQRLVEHFYAGVTADPVLRPLYPDPDLAAAADRLRLFLVQYWGGPRTYSEQRGHPRLRMRHASFGIGERERTAWLAQMRSAVDSLDLPTDQSETLWSYLETAAFSLQNR